VIWYYTFGVNCKKKFSRSHAHLFHFVKDPATYLSPDHVPSMPGAAPPPPTSSSTPPEAT